MRTDKTISESWLGLIRWLVVAAVLGGAILLALAFPSKGEDAENPYELDSMNERILVLEVQAEDLNARIEALEADNLEIKDTATTLGQLLAETGSK